MKKEKRIFSQMIQIDLSRATIPDSDSDMDAEAGGSAEVVLVLDLFFLRRKTNFFRSFLVAGEMLPVVD